jgi:hypothetical protein
MGRSVWKETGSRADGVMGGDDAVGWRGVWEIFWVTRRLDADVNEVPICCAGYDSMRQVKMTHNVVCLLADKWFEHKFGKHRDMK